LIAQRLRTALEERIALLAPARRLRLASARELLEAAAAGRALRVLDAGCGDGLLALALARRHPEWRLVGVDLNEQLLALARSRAHARGLANVRFAQGDLTRPLEEGGFDAVLAIECLTEIEDDRAALASLAGALAPGGVLIAHVPERDWRPVLRASAGTWRHEVRHGYAAEEIAEALRSAGLGEIDVRPTMRGLVTVAQELRDRIKGRRLAVRALAFPLMAAAVRVERLGATWGTARALVATGRRA